MLLLKRIGLSLAAAGLLLLCGCTQESPADTFENPVMTIAAGTVTTAASVTTVSEAPAAVETTVTTVTAFDRVLVPAYSGVPYCEINNSIPFFTEQDRRTLAYENYSPLDALGRCGVCSACIGTELMPVSERGSIGAIKPSGWQITRYDGLIEGNYLFNRCHLIGYLLTGQNANPSNLITGTRYLNKEGMLPFEIKTADFIRATGYHVLYRVTPVFSGKNLVADGVLMEALSVEDGGEGLRFNVYCYNVQPQIEINYATGESHLAAGAAFTVQTETTLPQTETTAVPIDRQIPSGEAGETDADYILNTNTMRFHKPDCKSVPDISERNKQAYTGERDALITEGYLPCGRCKP